MRNRNAAYALILSAFIAFFTTACSMPDDKERGNNRQNDAAPEKQLNIWQNNGIDPNNTYVVKDNVYLEDENMGGLTETQLIEKLELIAGRVDRKFKNARMDKYKWTIADKDKKGRQLDINRTAELLMSSGEGQRNKLVVEKVIPEITAGELAKNIVTIGEYTTPILDKTPARMQNLELAAETVNYEKLLPGKEFSFNDAVGKRTRLKGYEEAPIFIRTRNGPKKVDELGGGICQLSSTLYNAVDKAGLEVTERHSHSKKVYYVPYGRDATVNYGHLDFRFKNNRKYPVMIKVNVTKGQVTVRILENRNVEAAG